MKKLIDLNTYPVKEMLPYLLQDKTTKENIIFATDIYSRNDNELFPTEHITEENLKLIDIQPRVAKSLYEQNERTRSNAEVFTPSWICNKMNNFFCEEWFGKREIFNTEGEKTWNVNRDKISFTFEKSWQDFVKTTVLEITCGEAPFLVSRYDSATGVAIEVENRIGILDRKLRVVNENCSEQYEWFEWVKTAYQSTFGYEYQGDNLLIARINLLITFADNMLLKWHREPTRGELKLITNIIVWNIWQMDGLTGAQPLKEATENTDQTDMMSMFFDYVRENFNARIYSWSANKSYEFNDIKDGRKMKFDYVIGNPPYQDETLGENKGFAPPIYDKFMDASYALADVVELVHPARFLFNAGSTSKSWNRKILNDSYFKILSYTEKSSNWFTNTDIKGGVVISYRNTHRKGKPIEVFTPYNILNSLLKKVVNTSGFIELSSICVSRTAYRLTQKLHDEYPNAINQLSNGHAYDMSTNIFERLPEVFFESKPDDGNNYIQILGRIKNERTYRYVCKKYVNEVLNLNYYKVFLAKANGSGALGETMSPPIIGLPLTGNTESFISIGCFETEHEADALLNYIKTKFLRCLLGILKTTQDITPEKFKYVPLQDFTNNSDIDWSKSNHEIDLQLYKKYNLTDEEIEFIETHVKEMA